MLIGKKKYNELQKRFDNLSEDFSNLKKLVENNELKTLRMKEQELNKTRELLSHIQLKIKDVKLYEDDNTGKEYARITYTIDPLRIDFDDDGNPLKNEVFRAINMLDLTSLKDIERVQKVFSEERKGHGNQ